MTFFAKARSASSFAIAALLALGMVPATAFAADGAAATIQDATASDDAAALPVESDDTASSWRFDDGEPIAFPEEELVAGEDAEDVPGDDGLESENPGISLYANTVVPGTGITIPSYVRRPVGATRIGIDVSEHNGRIDWQAVKRAGVEFVIIRCGYGQDHESQHDDRWLDNVRGATAAGIPYGVYLYSYADTVAKAKGEAGHIIRLLRESNCKPEFPIYYDLEESSLESSKKVPLLAEMAFTFCSEVSRAGYTPAVYANTNWFNNYLTDPVFDAWGRWVAQYNSVCTYKGTYQMWQCTSDGYLAGLSGNNGRVDLNYELNNSSGHPASKTGLQMINGDMYYLDGAGNKKTGWQTVGRNTYYFGSDGIMFRGEQAIDGRKLSFNQAGALEGYWAKAGDAWYLRDQNGRNKIGWQHVKGSWYYLDPESGRMRTGWLQQGGNWCYLNGSGAMATGWVKVGGKDYYLRPSSGIMVTGKQTIGGKVYTFDGSGALVVNTTPRWVKSGGAWYLRSPEGKNLTGWQKVSGTWYYLDGSGIMQTGWLKLGKTWYYLKGSGAMAEGWAKVRGFWYYLNPGSGAMAKGWKNIGGTWYYLNGSGAMKTGWLKSGKIWYYFKGSGAMAEGWQKVSGTWYYLNPGSGAMKTGWLKPGKTWYYLSGSGAMRTGWQKIGGTWYYFRGSGAMVADEVITIGGKTYCFSASGAWV